MIESTCIFCKIIAGEIPAAIIYEDEAVSVFLDSGPLFPGHALVCPKRHADTLLDVPADQLAGLFSVVQLVSKAMETGLQADGSFIAINNKISQSVPHLHVHVVPRRKKDGLKGFFWPRRPYKDSAEMEQTRDALRATIGELQRTSPA